MNREIKFRFWDGTKMHITDFHLTCFGIVWMDTDDREGSNEERVLMQFTGLFDMYGKDVYEGDIIVDGREYADNRPYVIDWIEDDACFIGKHGKLNFSSCNWYKFAKIIGNIYENPKLFTP
jgi:hypothetical protein